MMSATIETLIFSLEQAEKALKRHQKEGNALMEKETKNKIKRFKQELRKLGVEV